MKPALSTIALIAGLGLAGSALAQPSGGPDAKGNAPLKAVHTVNDGTAKPGANSFTQNQARKHILNSGYTAVSGLAKGSDGVWRGTAMKDGASVNVALDFKGNVTEAGPAAGPAVATRRVAPAVAPAPVAAPEPAATDTGSSTSTMTTTTTSAVHHVHHHHRMHHRLHHHHHAHHGVASGGNGVAMSGIDRDHNGISDKEDRAQGATPQ